MLIINVEDILHFNLLILFQIKKVQMKNEVLTQMKNTNDQWENKVIDLKKQVIVKI